METFFKAEREYVTLRQRAYQKKDEILKQIKQKQKTKEETKNKDYFYLETLNEEELINIGKNISQEYKQLLKSTYTDQDQDKDKEGISFAFIDKFFKMEEIDSPYKERKEKKEKKNKDKDKDKPIEEICQDLYFQCLEKLKSFGIDVYKVEKTLDGFKNRSTSCLCGGTEMFYFFCGKNHYRFKAVFEDDCDCYPGLFIVREVHDIKNNKIYKSYVDLYGQNTSLAMVRCFMDLINSETYDEFLEKHYGHFLKLPNLLRKKGFDVEMPEDFCEKIQDNINLQDHYNSYRFVIKQNEDKVMISFVSKYKEDQYSLILVDPEFTRKKTYLLKDEIEEQIKKQKIDCNDHHYYKDSVYKFDYKSVEDFDLLVNVIQKYINYRKGKYGVYGGAQWFNDKNLKTFVDAKMEEVNKNKEYYGINGLECRIKEPCFEKGQILDVSILLWQGKDMYILKEEFNNEFPFSYYILNLKYNSNDCYCIMTINGYAKTFNIYEKGENEEDLTFEEHLKTWFKPSSQEIDINKENIGSYYHLGIFTEIFDDIKLFVNKICEINKI